MESLIYTVITVYVNWEHLYLEWPCSANFCAFDGTLKIFMAGLDQVWRMTLTVLNLWGFQLSAWNLVGWCTMTWSRHLFKLAMLSEFFARFSELWNVSDRLGPCLRDNNSYKEIWGNYIMTWKLATRCNVPLSGSLFEMATLSQCSHFLNLAGRGCCCSLNVLSIVVVV